jgi:hypothetical protein
MSWRRHRHRQPGIDIGGSGAVGISGRADSQEVSISGSGAYRAKDLQSEEAKIDVSGSGSAIVNASEALEAKVSGAGSVEYVGDPTVEEGRERCRTGEQALAGETGRFHGTPCLERSAHGL